MKRLPFALSIFLASVVLCPTVLAQTTIFVDGSNPNCPGSGTKADPYCKIQRAINNASNGDTILVAPGTYVQKLDFKGKAITVRSEQGPSVTIIDGNAAGPAVTFDSGEGAGSILDGFTITNGDAAKGGGILCGTGVSPRILNNTITGNHGDNGGGILVGTSASPLIANNVIHGNTAGSFVGGEGGGLNLAALAAPMIVNNTITANQAMGGTGSGIYNGNSANPTMINTIIWGNVNDNLAGSGSIYSITYCDIQSPPPMLPPSNISADPLFLDPGNDDYRIGCSSPCVDAGNSTPGVTLPVLDHERRDPRFLGGLDIGADEMGALLQFNGPATVSGANTVNFTFFTPANQAGGLGMTFLSLSQPGPQGGLKLLIPGSFGRKLDLAPDIIFNLWVGLPQILRNAALTGGCGGSSTFGFFVPPTAPVGLTLYYAGLTFPANLATLVSVAETKSFTIVP